MHVTVCVCTYRRLDGLRDLLQGLLKQTFQHVPQPRFQLLIADNEGNPEVKEICADFERRSSIPTVYVPEPQRGISYARNACLERLPPDTDFLVMIDDDEVPQPDWLDQLLLVQAETGADVVYGPVLPVFPPGTPAWIEHGGFFYKPQDPGNLIDRQEPKFAATSNALLRAEVVRQPNLRFEPTLALSGGEDTLFFREIAQAGYRIVWAAYARVWENVPSHRARFGYLWRSEFRRGNVKLFVALRLRERRGSSPQRIRLAGDQFIKSLKKMASGTAVMTRSLVSRQSRKDRLAAGALQIAGGLGMLTSVFGFKYRHY